MNKEQFAKCPFCGKSETLTIGKASDAFSEPDDCGDPMPYMHTESYAVTCDASKPDGPGGCGASGGYKLTEDEAIAAWNRRAALAQHQAKALEGVEPVACLVNADAGAMVWPISDIDEAETYCDEGEFPEPLYSATTVSALQARIATQAEHQAKALEGVQAFEFDPPPYHSEAMGCGLEDRGIRDRYEAMAYGWDEAMDRAYESIPDDLVSATTVSALRERIAELESELRRVTTSPPTGSAPCARLCEHMAFQIQAKSDARRIAELEQDAVRGEPVGFVMVPSGPTREMLNAAIDVDSFKLGDISPLGFRCSPQQLFERCYRAMLAAAPKETL